MLWKLALLLLLTSGADDAPPRERAAAEAEAPPKGHLVIVGGGATGEDVRLKALTLAGGPKAKVVVVPHASNLADAGERTAEWWREVGATNIVILDLHDPKAAAEQIRSADLIWMRGGNQDRLVKALEEGGVSAAIRERYREGATVGGTSAGAAVMSTRMISGTKGRRGTPEGDVPRLVVGLGLWPEVIVDQHFIKRHRINRLTRAVQDNPDLIGIGIDESTAVVVTGGEFEVIGASDVVVLDARKPMATDPRAQDDVGDGDAPAGSGPAAPAEAPMMVTHTLKPGTKYSLAKGLLAEPMAASVAPAP